MTNDTMTRPRRAPRGLEGLRITRRGRRVRAALLVLALFALELLAGSALLGISPAELVARIVDDTRALLAGYGRLVGIAL